MSNLVLIPENLMALSNAIVTAASEASASMADDNMLTEAPSEFWRSLSSAPGDTSFYCYNGTFRTASVDALALVGTNLYRGDQYRTWSHLSATPPPNYYEGLNPTGTVAGSTTNTASTFADCDSGEAAPGATFATPTLPGSAWSLGLSFATPSSPPATGADMQVFAIFVKKALGGSIASPTVTLELRESGALVLSLGTRTIKSTTGQWMFFPWNASLLGTASGANIECKVSFTSVSVSQFASMGAVRLCSDSVGARTNDSGWLTFDPWVGTGLIAEPEVKGSAATVLFQHGATINPNVVVVQLRVSQSPLDFDDNTEILSAPDNFVQVGCLIVGEAWSPATDRNFGPLISTKDWSSKSRTYGGQRFGSRRFVQRILSLPMDWLTPEEAHTLFDRLLWRHGILKPIFVSILPGDATEEKHTSFLATLRNPENVMTATTARGKSRSMTLEMEEEL